MDDEANDDGAGAALSRRSMLKGIGALAAGAALAACSSSSEVVVPHRELAPRRARPPPPTPPIRKPGSLPEPEAARGHRHAAADRAHRRADDGEPLLRRPLRHARSAATASSSARRAAARRQPVHRRQAAQGVPHAVDAASSHAHPGQNWDASHTAYNDGRNDGFVERAAARSRWATGTSTDIPFYYGLAQHVPAVPTAGSARCSRRRIRTGGS